MVFFFIEESYEFAINLASWIKKPKEDIEVDSSLKESMTISKNQLVP